MRKLAAITVSLAMLGVQTVQAEGFLGLGKINVDGSLEVLGQQAVNETDLNGGRNDHRGDTITRVMLGLSLPEITDGVSGRVLLSRNSGGAGTTVPGAPVQYGSGNDSLQTEQNTILVQNAYVDLMNFLSIDQIRLGRQFDGRQGDLLLYHGPVNDDAMTITSFDALVARKKFGRVDGVFGTGKINENDSVPGTANATDSGGAAPGDVNLSYVILSSAELIPNLRLPLELGYYRATADNTTVANDNQTLVTYDLRAGYGFMNDALNLGAEFAMNGGQDNNNNTATTPASKTKYKGNAFVLKGSYDSAERGFGLKAFLANASGHNQNTGASVSSDHSFHDTNVLGVASTSDFRFGEILSNSNSLGGGFGGPGLDRTGAFGNGLNVIGVGGHYNPAFWESKLDFSLDLYTVKLNKVASGAHKDIGTEYDAAIHYRYSNNVTASVGYAMLNPGSGLAEVIGFSTKTDDVTKLFAKLSIKWGAVQEPVAAPAPASRPATRTAPARRFR